MYGFGVDYAWYQSENILDFLNSMKMKIAVIVGVAHMTLGIILKGLNSRYFYKSLDFYFEFIPQLVLLLALFGYMDMLIFLKWGTKYDDTGKAPSIITIMIDMFLSVGAVNETPLVGSRSLHETVNILILMISFVCVPVMLLVKPLILTQEIRRKESHLKSPSAIEMGA